MRKHILALASAFTFATISAASTADAFCGFYVSDADQKLYNNATLVVLMRDGTRTVLSMQNNYQGPPENFAMVVPVPVVLSKDNVKTLPPEIFDKIDKLASPRLVEYWERDPCAPPMPETKNVPRMVRITSNEIAIPDGVKVEARFNVGEYEVVILSARDSGGLDRWLRKENYKIPEGSEPLLRPYVQSGSKFFVAKVDTKKVRFENGQAMLSPLRFHYDSDSFSLPVRLGLLNSAGTQDLIVHILAHGQRYEAANRPNVAIPTNIDVNDKVRKDFGAFYAALFDRTLARQPRAAITEYAWDASSCDPCPGPTLEPMDFLTLGADVLVDPPKAKPGTKGAPPRPQMWGMGGFVLTRLHLRYGKDEVADDLVFRTAPPMMGGREFLSNGNKLETGAVQGMINNFQGRYAIRHVWKGAIACANPVRGIWGGQMDGMATKMAEGAQKLAFAKRGGFDLVAMTARDDNETKIDNGVFLHTPAVNAPAPDPEPAANTTPSAVATAAPAPTATGAAGPPATPPQGGCAGCRVGESEGSVAPIGAGIVAAIGIAVARVLRRKKTR